MSDERGVFDRGFTWVAAGLGLWMCYIALTEGHPWWPMGPLFLVASFGLWKNQPWGHLMMLAVSSFLGIHAIGILILVEFTWGRLGFLLLVIFGVREFWIDYLLSKQSTEDESPMTSLVLLQRTHRELDCESIAAVLGEAWGEDFTTGESEDDDEAEVHSVRGEPPVFFVAHGSEFYLVHNHGRKYFDDEAAVCEALKELRLIKAVTDHEAWISVDMMHSMSLRDPESFYPEMAIAVAEFADENTLAIYRPDTGHINIWDAELKRKLLDGDPVQAITEPTNVPVVPIKDDDPRMLAATAEARSRWPEFIAAFGKREPGQTFSVKAPVSREGNTEFIWIEVTAIEGENIRGDLGNDPVDLGRLKMGDEVVVPVADLNDWVYAKGDDLIGLFTVKVINEAMGEGQ